MYDWLIVGAGFAGSVMAERIASVRNEKILLIDRRPHLAGNAYDVYNEHGILIHKYGPHIFHTNSKQIFDYLSRFTRWRKYEHRVRAQVDGTLVPIPINADTIKLLYGLDLNPAEMEKWLSERAQPVDQIKNSEDVVVSQVGRELFAKFFEGYTTKQWGVPPRCLSKSVTARVPVRTNRDDRYFTDQYQYMPRDGYTTLFKAMVNHPNITVALNTDFRDVPQYLYRSLVVTGPIDEYFDYRFGKLPYRSLQFRHITLDKNWHQPVGVVNYPQTEEYTRVTEYKHLTGQSHAKTSITFEYPCASGEPYYPVPCDDNAQLFKRYEALTQQQENVWFVGRLATYRYYNMDQVVGQALATFKHIQERAALDCSVTA
jgi:UDP-galactopyranose mutase